MAYDRFGYPKPTPRNGVRRVPSTPVAVAVCLMLGLILCIIAWLCMGGTNDTAVQTGDAVEDAQPNDTPSIRHESLGPTYTTDDDIICWYVFVDPDTQVQYLVNDRGGCTPRLDADSEVM